MYIKLSLKTKHIKNLILVSEVESSSAVSVKVLEWAIHRNLFSFSQLHGCQDCLSYLSLLHAEGAFQVNALLENSMPCTPSLVPSSGIFQCQVFLNI